MAKYIEIKGHSIQAVATDPEPYAGAWSSGGSLNAERSNAGGAGIQTSALMIGQDGSPQAIVEEYNGSSWSEVGDLTTGRNAKCMGANAEAALAVGGYDPGVSTGSVKTETFDGSSWTEVGDLNVKREAMGTFGIATAGIIASGFERGSSPSRPVNVESWNGSAWTEVANVNQSRSTAIGSGIQTSGIISGGNPAPAQNLVESWDGSSWTEVGDLNTPRGRYGGGSGTSNTSAMVFGGYADPPTTVLANTEVWNGSTWTEVADLSTARNDQSSSTNAPTSLSLSFGGLTPPETTATEEWSFPSNPVAQVGQVWFNTDSVTLKGHAAQGTGSWASGTSLNQARSFNGTSGNIPSALTFGGSPAPTQAYTEQYNGSAWTEVGDLNEGRIGGAAGGSSGTDAIYAGGYELPNTGNSVNTETWNGSTWTETANLNAQKYTSGSGIPVSTSGIAFGGNPVVATAETWDNSSWTEVGDLNTGRMYLGGFGSATSAIAGNGVNPGASPGYTQNVVEKWDGSSWSEVGSMNTARGEMYGGQGTSNDGGIIAGGAPNATTVVANVEEWNGSSWTEVGDLGTAGRMAGQVGSIKSGMYVGGQRPSDNVTNVEEWTVTGATKTLSVS